MYYHSVLQSISPTLKYSAHSFLPRPEKNSKSFRPPLFMSNPPQYFGELDSHPPLEMYPLQKRKDLFFLKKQILFPTLNKNTIKC